MGWAGGQNHTCLAAVSERPERASFCCEPHDRVMLHIYRHKDMPCKAMRDVLTYTYVHSAHGQGCRNGLCCGAYSLAREASVLHIIYVFAHTAPNIRACMHVYIYICTYHTAECTFVLLLSAFSDVAVLRRRMASTSFTSHRSRRC